MVISVSTLLDRVARLATEPSLGASGAEAAKLLAQRGLGADTIQAARSLLTKLSSAEAVGTLPTPSPETQAQTEAAMWDWYLEWGEIARVAVTDRRLLRELGFLNSKRPVAQEEADTQPAGENEGNE